QYLGELGALVEVRRNNQVTLEEIDALRPERIVISPGPCTPEDAGISIELIRHFVGSYRYSEFAWDIRQSGLRSEARWSAPKASCMAKPARSSTTARRSSASYVRR